MIIDGLREPEVFPEILPLPSAAHEHEADMSLESIRQVLFAIEKANEKWSSSEYPKMCGNYRLHREHPAVEDANKVSALMLKNVLSQCDEAILGELDISELMPVNQICLQPLENLLKLRVVDVENHSLHILNVLRKRLESIPMEKVELGENEDIRTMPFVKLLRLSKEELNSCIDKLSRSIVTLLAQYRCDDIDSTKLTPTQLYAFLDLGVFPKEVVQERFSRLLPSQIDPILNYLCSCLTDLITDEQFPQLTFQGVDDFKFWCLFCGDSRRGYRVQKLTPAQVNAHLKEIFWDYLPYLSDFQLTNLDWDRVTQYTLPYMFEISQENYRDGVQRRIKELSPEQINIIREKLPFWVCL